MSSRPHPSCLHTPEIVIYFICRIESSYPNERILFVSHFCNQFIARIDDYALNENNTANQSNAASIANEKEKHRFYTDEDFYNAIKNTPFHHVLSLFAPYIIQHRFLCPFSDTRDAFTKLLHHINDKLQLNLAISSPPYPLSGFLNLSSTLLPYEECTIAMKSETDVDFEEIYTNFGRISHFSLLISQHKEYLRDFNDLFSTLMNSNYGPLGREKRQYLGLMAASRYSCDAIVTQCELKYRQLNGDATWIKSGINSAPTKYAKLAKINALLAHQPWLLNAQHISDLVHGNGAWTISECVQSFVILIMYHFLCGMYQGLCITPDIDLYYTSILQSHCDRTADIKEIFDKILMIDANKKSEDDETKNHATNNNEEDDDDSYDEDQRSQNIAKLLSHTQQQLLCDEDIVGGKRQGFEQSACLNREMDSVSESPLFPQESASRSCFIKFRQLSDSGNDEEHDSLLDDSRSISMEYDPNMAPSSLSANDLVAVMAAVNKEEEEKEQKVEEKMVDVVDCNKLTSSDWKQLITLRKENMFPLASDCSNGLNNDANNNNNLTWETDEEKLAKITNPAKNVANGAVKTNNNNNKKKKKYAKIAAPVSQGTQYWKYSLGIDMTYNDFDCHKNYQIHAYDFNWDKHGYALLSRYYPGIEKKMDCVFKTAYTMTDHCINGKDNLDTEPFRIAVWHYTFRLYGVHNDSYEYRFVNIYLPVKLKIFIKKLVCYPQIVTIDDVKKMGVALKEKEKIHVAILALEAKKQAALLFGLRAIMKYVQSN